MAKKLQGEIDKTLKKVDEGVEAFDSIWDKVYSASTSAQKEKYEVDLKKEIKKLQRFRDQIKAWCAGTEVKDKTSLLECRKLIESKMEQFKVCEKETKTKAYSKEGLAQGEKLDPEMRAKHELIEEVAELISKLRDQIEVIEYAAETGTPVAGGEIKVNEHKLHIDKMEQIMRLLDNDELDIQAVLDIKDGMEYYVESNQDDDFYADEGLYDDLNLEETVKATALLVVEKKDAGKKDKKNNKKEKEVKSSPIVPSASSTKKDSIPEEVKEEEPKEEVKEVKPSPTPVKVAPPVVVKEKPTVNAKDVAKEKEAQRQQAIKEREEKIKKERAAELQAQAQKKALENERQKALLEKNAMEVKRAAEVVASTTTAPVPPPSTITQTLMSEKVKVVEEIPKPPSLVSVPSHPTPSPSTVINPTTSSTTSSTSTLLNSSTSSNIIVDSSSESSSLPNNSVHTSSSTSSKTQSKNDPYSLQLNALQASFNFIPRKVDSHRPKSRYVPSRPFNVPASFPLEPAPVFDNLQNISKFDKDTLFFMFYFQNNSHHQYLAAKELKKKSWRFHKKYSMWFQRFEEPTIATEEYERGTYTYFDSQTSWSPIVKSDFTFEYEFLEDE